MSRAHSRHSILVLFAAGLLVAPALAGGGKGGGGKGGGGGGSGGGDPPPPPDPALVFKDTQDYSIAVMNEDGSNVTKVYASPSSACSPFFRADGQEIFWVDTIGGQAGIWAIGVDGTGLRLITPVYAPGLPDLIVRHTGSVVSTLDGVERIAFCDVDPADPENSYLDLYVVGVDGSGRQRLQATNRDESRPSWSPGGDFLCVEAGLEGIVILGLGLDAAGQVVVESEAPLSELPGSPLNGADASWTAWAHHQPWIAVAAVTPDTGNQDLWLVDLRSPTTPLRLTQTGAAEGFPSFSPDDASIFFYYGRGTGGVYRINVDGSGYTKIRSYAMTPHRRAF